MRKYGLKVINKHGLEWLEGAWKLSENSKRFGNVMIRYDKNKHKESLDNLVFAIGIVIVGIPAFIIAIPLVAIAIPVMAAYFLFHSLASLVPLRAYYIDEDWNGEET